jgi:hypothetical protein
VVTEPAPARKRMPRGDFEVNKHRANLDPRLGAAHARGRAGKDARMSWSRNAGALPRVALHAPRDLLIRGLALGRSDEERRAGREEPQRPGDVGRGSDSFGELPAGRLVAADELERADHEERADDDAEDADPAGNLARLRKGDAA